MSNPQATAPTRPNKNVGIALSHGKPKKDRLSSALAYVLRTLRNPFWMMNGNPNQKSNTASSAKTNTKGGAEVPDTQQTEPEVFS